MAFYDIQEVLDYMHDLLDTNKGELGLRYVGYGDEQILPEYPACQIIPGAVTRELHGTQRFRNVWNLEIYVYHGLLTVSYSRRVKEDLQLVARVRSMLHSNMRFVVNGEAQIVQGWIDSESPGVLTAKGDVIVGTRLTWRGEGHEPYTLPQGG